MVYDFILDIFFLDMADMLMEIIFIMLAGFPEMILLNEVEIPFAVWDFEFNGVNITTFTDNSMRPGVDVSWGDFQAGMCSENSIGTSVGSLGSLGSLGVGEMGSNNTLYVGIPQNNKLLLEVHSENQTRPGTTLPENFINEVLTFFQYTTVGIVGNIVTIVYIVVKKKIRKPFFVCIVNLAFADLICLLTYSKRILLPETTFVTDPCTYYWVEKIVAIVRKSAKCLALLAVLNMGIVRFLLFVYPLKSRAYLTTKKILIICGVSVPLSAGYGYLIHYLALNTIGTMYYVVSVLIDAIFFIMIAAILILFFYKRLMTARRSTSAQNTKLKMSIVTLIILFLNILTQVVSVIDNLQYVLFSDGNHDWFQRFQEVLLLGADALVHSINPYIYLIKFSNLKACFVKQTANGTK